VLCFVRKMGELASKLLKSIWPSTPGCQCRRAGCVLEVSVTLVRPVITTIFISCVAGGARCCLAARVMEARKLVVVRGFY
jgi:hypothetical protein